MATLRAAFKAALTGDATLMALLTGGVLDAQDLNFTGEGAYEAPRESDGVRLKPHAVIRWGERSPQGSAIKVRGKLETVEAYVYQDTGFDVIEGAIIRMESLLCDTYLQTDDRALAHITEGSFTSGELPAEELGNAACKFVRFFVVTAPG